MSHRRRVARGRSGRPPNRPIRYATLTGCWSRPACAPERRFDRSRPSANSSLVAIVDGFVQQYRDGGWIARWSSPGYANLMTGTSSDAAFADAFVKGVPGLDARDTYDAAVKNATVAPPGDPWNPSVGRKGQIVAPFLGYTPSRVSEGVSWALEGDINDFGIANMAQKLGGRDARAGGSGSGCRRSASTSSAARRTT